MAEFDSDVLVRLPDSGCLEPILQGELPSPSTKINVLLVGSGLSKAAHAASPTWEGLLQELRQKLLPGAAGSKIDDYMVEALRLSRGHSRRRDARPTGFQQAIRDVVSAHWTTRPAGFDTLAAQIHAFIEAIGADVIVDLNYDPLMEWVLQERAVRYVKATGSEVHWTGPLPAGAKLLWKLHGDLAAPSTIVLSPTEYQRMYEVNALGTELDRLGQRAGVIWSVGVGLTDDDVWSYLCGPNSSPSVRALLLTSQDTTSFQQQKEWWKIVASQPAADVRILHAHYEHRPMAEMLEAITKGVVSVSAPRHGCRGGLSRYLEGRSKEFDELYEHLRRGGDGLQVVSQFKNDFEAIRESLLCASTSHATRSARHRWLPAIGSRSNSASLLLDKAERRNLEEDVSALVREATELCAQYVRPGEHAGLLVACAAQAALGYVFELADLLGISCVVEVDPAPRKLLLQSKQTLLVGSNPFFMRGPRTENAMHFFETERPLAIGAPILGWSPPVTPPPTPSSPPPKLLKEDEWEASVLHVYYQRNPRILIGDGKKTECVKNVPPIYPWGFRLLDVGAFRATYQGAVSVCWQLVDGFLGENQICKGGALRDRGRRAFRIGGRGQLRIGEYDDFVAPAYHYP